MSAVGDKWTANGSIANAEITPPRNTAGTKFTSCPRFFKITTLMADAIARRAREAFQSTLALDSMRKLPANIAVMPAIAMKIASQGGWYRRPKDARASNAVTSGATAT